MLGGVLFAAGRRTVTAWLRAAGLARRFRAGYAWLDTLGRRTAAVAAVLLGCLLRTVAPIDATPLRFALDDTPTPRVGPKVQGAGLHHNPTPGPAAQRFLYGHVWVPLALVLPHRLWGAIAFPLLARLDGRRADVAAVPAPARWTFQTKLEQAADLIRWAAATVRATARAV
jgi:hypothetical protein